MQRRYTIDNDDAYQARNDVDLAYDDVDQTNDDIPANFEVRIS